MRNYVEQCMKDVAHDLIKFPFGEAKYYQRWLSQTYHIVKHSTPMLAIACGRSIDNKEFHDRCIEHLAEEKGHDKMLLNDLKNSNLSLENSSAFTRAFVTSQYYWIEHVKPTSFLGYILFLEALAINFGNQAADTAKRAGFATGFLKLHANEDPNHLEKAFTTIEKISPEEQEMIKENLLNSTKIYGAMLQEQATEKYHCSLAA